MKQFMVMGEFDFVGICQPPETPAWRVTSCSFGAVGFVRTKTLKAFPETAYREIVRSLG